MEVEKRAISLKTAEIGSITKEEVFYDSLKGQMKDLKFNVGEMLGLGKEYFKRQQVAGKQQKRRNDSEDREANNDVDESAKRHIKMENDTSPVASPIKGGMKEPIVFDHAAAKALKKYPPPFPSVPPYNNQKSWDRVPPAATLTVKKGPKNNSVVLTWEMKSRPTVKTAKVNYFEIFQCRQTEAAPDSKMWKKVGNVPSKTRPMTCLLDAFKTGYIYFIAIRAVDEHDRRAPFAIEQVKF